MSKSVSAKRWMAGAAAVTSLVAFGCAGEPVGTESVKTTTQDSSDVHEQGLITNTVNAVVAAVGPVVTSTLSATGQAVGVCAPLTCCFPTGTEWNDNAFENGLKALGCTAPAAYTERYGSTNWWMFTKCTQTPALTALVVKYATVAPYNAQYAINECLYLNQKQMIGTDVFIQFDPTCTSCRSAVAK